MIMFTKIKRDVRHIFRDPRLIPLRSCILLLLLDIFSNAITGDLETTYNARQAIACIAYQSGGADGSVTRVAVEIIRPILANAQIIPLRLRFGIPMESSLTGLP